MKSVGFVVMIMQSNLNVEKGVDYSETHVPAYANVIRPHIHYDLRVSSYSFILLWSRTLKKGFLGAYWNNFMHVRHKF